MEEEIISKISKYNISKLQKYFDEQDVDTLIKLKNYLDDLYYNTGESSELSDEKYDLLKEMIQEKKPDYQMKVGAKLRESDNKVELPYYLGSANKVKTQEEILKWLSKNKSSQYVIQEKLDGVSCLIIYKNNKISLYTRGDGEVGQDISYYSSYFKNLPKVNDNLIVRAELIIPKAIFEKKYSEKFSNPRNTVSGIVNSKKFSDVSKDVEVVTYEIINPDSSVKTIECSEQLKLLSKYGFKTAKYEILENIDYEILTRKLIEFKENSEFEIDGIIVQSDNKYFRNTSGNPSYMFAFKQNLEENIKETEVIEVEWNVSKHGVLKPRVKVKQVEILGVKINYATGHNAKNIYDNNIGPNAKILVTRANEVIPFIVEVLVPAEKPQMPNIPYKWNKTNVDIMVEGDEYNETMCVKLIASFFEKLGIKHVSEATVSKMYEYGLDSLLKIIGAKQSDFEKIEGFGARLAERTYENIHSGLQNVEVYKVLGASSIFGIGIGERKLKLLFDEYPLILSDYKKVSKNTLYSMINGIEGYSDITTEKIVENLDWAKKFIDAISLFSTFKDNKKSGGDVSNELEGKKFVFSKIRDEDLEKQIKKKGGQVTTSVSSKTYALILGNKEQSSNKINKAKQLGILVYEKDEFIEKYIKKSQTKVEPKIETKSKSKIESTTSVINGKVEFIRKKGYANLKELLDDPKNVYIARAGVVFVKDQEGNKFRYPKKDSIWANPFKVDKDGTREEVIEKYRKYIIDKINRENLWDELEKLRGKNLVCWCKPEACHGDVLVELLEQR